MKRKKKSMYPNQQPPLYTTRQYIYEPQSNYNGPIYNQSRSQQPPPYPYYSNNQQPTTVTYINDRQNYGQPSSSYVPPNVNHYPSSNTHIRSSSIGGSGGSGGSGQIEKTNMMSSQNPFIDPARPYEQYNAPRTVKPITSAPKTDGSVNKTLNLSDENPFHSTYGRYHYPSQIDPTKRITNQAASARSTDNKSLNLSDENPFYSTYGRYHYPSQIDPAKRITEIPKAAGPLMPTNEMSDENPFNNSYRPPPTYRDYSNAEPAPLSYRPVQNQRPPQNNYNQQSQPSSYRPRTPPAPSPPPPARIQPQKPPSNAPLDKTSLNMSPDNPFASTYGQYHYPSPEEIKAQKRINERNNRFADQQPINNNNRPVQPNNQMSEYPETENKEVLSGKGNSKFSRFDVNF